MTGTEDQAWEVSWELFHADGGTRPPGDLGLELVFCQALGSAVDGGICTGETRRVLAYNDANLTPWYLTQSVANATRQVGATSTTFTTAPVGCACISSTRMAPGAYFINVAAVERTAPEPLRYRITQSLSTYPGSLTGADGGACPVVADAGCGFAR